MADLRQSRMWQDSMATSVVYDGDPAIGSTWLGYAKQKLKFMLKSTPGATSNVFKPTGDVEIRVFTRPNKIIIATGGAIAIALPDPDHIISPLEYDRTWLYRDFEVKRTDGVPHTFGEDNHLIGASYWVSQKNNEAISWAGDRFFYRGSEGFFFQESLGYDYYVLAMAVISSSAIKFKSFSVIGNLDTNLIEVHYSEFRLNKAAIPTWQRIFGFPINLNTEGEFGAGMTMSSTIEFAPDMSFIVFVAQTPNEGINIGGYLQSGSYDGLESSGGGSSTVSICSIYRLDISISPDSENYILRDEAFTPINIAKWEAYNVSSYTRQQFHLDDEPESTNTKTYCQLSDYTFINGIFPEVRFITAPMLYGNVLYGYGIGLDSEGFVNYGTGGNNPSGNCNFSASTYVITVDVFTGEITKTDTSLRSFHKESFTSGDSATLKTNASGISRVLYADPYYNILFWIDGYTDYINSLSGSFSTVTGSFDAIVKFFDGESVQELASLSMIAAHAFPGSFNSDAIGKSSVIGGNAYKGISEFDSLEPQYRSFPTLLTVGGGLFDYRKLSGDTYAATMKSSIICFAVELYKDQFNPLIGKNRMEKTYYIHLDKKNRKATIAKEEDIDRRGPLIDASPTGNMLEYFGWGKISVSRYPMKRPPKNL